MAQTVDPISEQLNAFLNVAGHSLSARLGIRKTPALPGASRYNRAPRFPARGASPDYASPLSQLEGRRRRLASD